ncbi:ribosome biogenesis GTPase YlqF [Clostridium sp. BJN0001]|uniref:ribosome biogenesis GTPase YlqF n=1 Tax=Clostridium sp. BJN0001 TaxID=2930219 RepID=UPI001FD624CB|nr:ribosome biogenesis GTPase YlqF [Clostridium sp. BJN0001]
MAINWFPGHMRKTQREIRENLKLVDAVIEIRDARIPESSKNPDIDKILKDKKRLIILNKSDLSDRNITKKWIEYLTNDGVMAIEANSLNGSGINSIKPALMKLLKEKYESLERKGIKSYTIRAMVVGIPNVGKSTFINKIARNSTAKTGNKPGVTKSKQWIRTKAQIELLDTPGVLWPKLQDDKTALNLAFTGAIKDEVMDNEYLALKLVEKLQKDYPEILKARYKLDEIFENPLDTLNAMAKKRGALIKGGEIDYNRIANSLLDEFRGGKIGKISFEVPNKK